MKISSLVEMPDGIYKFEGELGEAESKLVIELGIAQLMKMGAFGVAEQAAKTLSHGQLLSNKEMH